MGQRKQRQNTKTKVRQIETTCRIVSSSGHIINKPLDKDSLDILENSYIFALVPKTISPKIIISGYNRNCIVWDFRRSNEIIRQKKQQNKY